MIPWTDEFYEIKAALEACKTRAELETTADHYREQVKAMHKRPGEKEHALHILNLRDMLRKEMGR